MDKPSHDPPVDSTPAEFTWGESLFQHLPDPVFIYDHTIGRIIHANEAALKRYGYSLAEMTRRAPWDVEKPYSRDVLWPLLEGLVESGRQVYETIHRTKDGVEFPVEMHTRLIREAGHLRFVAICRDLTERRRAEEARREAETRYRSIFDLSPDCLGVLRLEDHRWIEVNPAFTRSLGWEREKLLRLPFLELVVPGDREATGRVLLEPLRAGEAITAFENRIESAAGEVRWYRWSAQPDPEGGLAYVVGRDTTNQKRSESVLSDLVGVSPVAMLIADRDLNVVAVNSTFEEDFGYTAADVANVDRWGELAYPDEEYRKVIREDWERQYAEARKRGARKLISPEIVVRCKDGSERIVQAGAGLTADHLILVFVDLTAQKRVEEAYRRQSQRLALHIERTPLAVVEWDLNFCISAWNPAAEQVFGYTAKEVIGRNAAFLVPEAFQHLVNSVWESLLNQEGGARSLNGNVRKDGTEILCEWYNTPLVDDRGQVSGVASLVRDVTKRHQRELDLVRAREEAERANQAKSEFLSIMSHELRTPLNAIIGPCELLEEGLAEVPVDEARELLAIMHSSANHLLDLINSVLDLAKIESGEVLPEVDRVPIAEFLRERLRPLAQVASKKSLGFDLRHALAEDDLLETDRRFLLQILFNLVGNAVKFTERGRIEVRAEPVGDGRLRIEVEDTGVGIPAAQIGQIFEPFKQVDMSINRQHEGAGLGLSICRRLADSLGGSLTARSEVGKGSVFCLELPGFRPEGRIPGPDSAGPAVAPARPARLLPRRVLVVEDDAQNRTVFASLFRRLDLPCEFAEDGPQALERFAAQAFPIVLMDIRLPGMNGLEVTRRLRQLPGGMDAYVIAQSAFAMKEQRDAFLDEGMDAFLAKPVTLEELRQALSAADQFLAR